MIPCLVLAFGLRLTAYGGFPFGLGPSAFGDLTEDIARETAHGLRDAGRVRFALRDPLRVELPQPPAGFRRLGEALDEMGKLRRAVQELDGLLELRSRRGAAVEVVIDGEDRRAVRDVERALLLAGELQRVDRVRVSPPHRLLRGEQRRQADAEGLRPFQLEPLINAHELPV